MHQDPKRGFFCFDTDEHDEHSAIWGTELGAEYQRLEMTITPCNFIDPSWTEGVLSDECITDLQEQKRYIDQSHWVLLVNQERFNP